MVGFLVKGQSEPSRFHVKGKIINGRSQKGMKHLPIKVMPFNKTIETDRKGEFLFNMPKGEFSLEIDYPPFEKMVIPLPVTKDTSFIIALKSSFSSQYLDEVEVISHKTVAEAPAGINQINSNTLKFLPALNGERDILKAFSITSGVSSSAEGSSEIQVRGGVHGQNLFLLDEIPLYSTQHMFGMVSTYNSVILKSAELYKSAFPAEFGGKLSGIINVLSNDANTSKLNGEAELGLLSTKANLNIPILKDKLGISLAGRISNYTLINLVNLFTPIQGFKIGLDFADLNANVTWKISDIDKLKLTYFYNRDGILSQDNWSGEAHRTQISNQQQNIRFSWDRRLSESTNNHLVVYADNYNFMFLTKQYDELTGANQLFTKSTTAINSYSALNKLSTSLSDVWKLKCGVDAKGYLFQPMILTSNDSTVNSLAAPKPTIQYQGTAFVETKYDIIENQSVTTGLRATTMGNSSKIYSALEPRISYHGMITPDFAINASACRMTQPIHRVANGGLGLPLEIFAPSDAKIKPESSWNFSLGCAKDIIGDKQKISFTADCWYKSFENITAFKDGHDVLYTMLVFQDPFSMNTSNIITQGKGEAYGFDFSSSYDYSWLKLTVDYTLMKATNQFAELNQGRPFAAPTDMRHTLSTTAEVKLSDTWTFSAMWQYHTGRPITVATEVYPNINFNASTYSRFNLIESERNNYRTKEFHRLDIAFSNKYKAFKKYDGLFSVGIYNVYNRANPYLYYIDTQNINGTPTPVLKSMSIFPILPSVSWSVRF
jgi:outer membrane receptor for ferrienterochelin and colicin